MIARAGISATVDNACRAFGPAGGRMHKVSRMSDAESKGGGSKDPTTKGTKAMQRPRNTLEERWLERKVRDMYQEVVDEPVPKELLDIVKRIPKLND